MKTHLLVWERMGPTKWQRSSCGNGKLLNADPKKTTCAQCMCTRLFKLAAAQRQRPGGDP